MGGGGSSKTQNNLQRGLVILCSFSFAFDRTSHIDLVKYYQIQRHSRQCGAGGRGLEVTIIFKIIEIYREKNVFSAPSHESPPPPPPTISKLLYGYSIVPTLNWYGKFFALSWIWFRADLLNASPPSEQSGALALWSELKISCFGHGNLINYSECGMWFGFDCLLVRLKTRIEHEQNFVWDFRHVFCFTAADEWITEQECRRSAPLWNQASWTQTHLWHADLTQWDFGRVAEQTE